MDAYTRLGNIQGNAYDQNLGDPAGALVSLGKALAIAQPLAASNSKDREAIRALALVQQSRSEILWQTDRTPEAVPVMREAVKSFDALIADPHAPAALVCDVASAYGTLGDELGQSGTASLADSAGAVAAYRQSVALDDRVLSVDPNFLRAKRGLSINGLKIGSVEMETDPAEALKEFQLALQRADALPKAEQGSLSGVRMRAMLLRKQANALERLGEYAQAAPLFEQALVISQRLAAQDPKDFRALFDVVTVLDDEAKSYEDAADPVLAAKPGDRRANLILAEKNLVEAAADLERLLKQDPANDVWKAFLASMQVRIGVIRASLHTPGASDELSRKGLAALKEVAEKDQASPMVLDQAANAFLTRGAGLPPESAVCRLMRRARGGDEPCKDALQTADPGPGLSRLRPDREEPRNSKGRPGAAAGPSTRKREAQHPQAARKRSQGSIMSDCLAPLLLIQATDTAGPQTFQNGQSQGAFSRASNSASSWQIVSDMPAISMEVA